MTTKIQTLRVVTHECGDCGYHAIGANVPDLCPHCGQPSSWTTETVSVAVAFGRRAAGQPLSRSLNGPEIRL